MTVLELIELEIQINGFMKVISHVKLVYFHMYPLEPESI